MSNAKLVKVSDLNLDLKNYRTTPQKNEISATRSLIAINPTKYWALMESIINDGYLPTENIIAIKSDGKLVVKEGNRRISILKLIHRHNKSRTIELPANIQKNLAELNSDWLKNNTLIPCAIYEEKDKDLVDKIVSMTHAKGQKAGRDDWPSVARARYNRDENGKSEPELNLLEKYLKSGSNITNDQKERWSGDYPFTVLEEAIKQIYPRFEMESVEALAKSYPKIKYREALEKIMANIGLNNITFPKIRDKNNDFAEFYGLPKLNQAKDSKRGATSILSEDLAVNDNLPFLENLEDIEEQDLNTNGSNKPATASSNYGYSVINSNSNESGSKTNNSDTKKPRQVKATAINDPKTVRRLLKSFSPSGVGREKVVSLKDEAINLTISKNPIAFCFLLRSMFEISVKAYFKDHAKELDPNKTKIDSHTQKNKLIPKDLSTLLKEAKTHLTQNGQNDALKKELHGAGTELARKDGILSVTSMNQLVHNASFSVTESDICTLFSKIFPLLKALN